MLFLGQVLRNYPLSAENREGWPMSHKLSWVAAALTRRGCGLVEGWHWWNRSSEQRSWPQAVRWSLALFHFSWPNSC